MSEKIQHGYKMVTIGKKIAFLRGKAKATNLLKKLVPEVGIPSNYSGQAHRHGVEAPRDFESKNQRHVTQRNN
ncbi:MAG: hypothetical protein A2157_07405 [Deltaproteobacteria bacterium RBG_16_47_11]|nr:MAG: hypothetical protein A2157_07405 [Deltaproteobacteria bacterium RBG_16_47_11]